MGVMLIESLQFQLRLELLQPMVVLKTEPKKRGSGGDESYVSPRCRAECSIKVQVNESSAYLNMKTHYIFEESCSPDEASRRMLHRTTHTLTGDCQQTQMTYKTCALELLDSDSKGTKPRDIGCFPHYPVYKHIYFCREIWHFGIRLG